MGIRSLRTTVVALAAVLVLVVGTAGQALACGTRERNENLHLETSVGFPTLSPSISLSLAVDRQTAIPGDKLTYSAVVTNTASNLTITGEIQASNSNRTAATIGAWYDVVSSDPKGRCGDCDQDSHGNDKDKWTPLAAAAGELAGHMPVQKAPTAPGMTFSAVPVTAKGVTYPSGTDTISGTSIGPSATARWEFTAVLALTPAQAKALFKGSEALPIRQSFHAEPTSGIIADSNEATLASVNFCQQLTMKNSGSATNVSVAITLPDGTVRTLNKSTTAALESIAPGASATATTSYTVPVPAAKGASETDAAYHARLAALDAKRMTASATARVGTAGLSVAAPAPATTTETVPILSLTKTGPATVDAGKSATYDLALSNNGSASARSLTLADSLPDGTAIPTGGTPAALAPAATGTAHASYAVPAAQPAGDLTDTASLRWTDANGNIYGPISSNATTKVTRPTVTVTVIVTASSGSITYGGAVPAITPSYSGWLGGDGPEVLTTAPACTTTATNSSGVGTYKTSCSGAAAPNYTFSYAEGTITVKAAPVIVTASSGAITYGGTVPAITPGYSGWVGGDSPSVLTTAPTCTTTAKSASLAGTYSSSCSGAAAPNYTFSYADGSVTVNPALVTVTASSGSMTYGATVPTITPFYSGWAKGDGPAVLTSAPTCSTAATSTSGVGTYKTSCSGAAAANYTFSYVDGSVTVNPALVTVTASSDSMTYGATVPVITPAYSGWVNGEGPSVLTTAPTCTTTATKSSPAGTYSSSCSGAAAANYTFSYVEGTISVNPTVVIVTASSGSITYGGAVPAITPSYSGWLGGDGPSVLTTAPACTTTATSASGVGTYKTRCSGAAAPNYTFVYADGTITVTPALVTLTAPSGSMTYGGTVPAITPAYSGWVGGDGPSVLTSAPTCTTTAKSASLAGTYSSSCSGAAAANYTFAYVEGSVTVNPALVTVTASSGSLTYGATAPAITASYSGWANGESPSVLTTAPVCTTAATSASPAGTYKTSCSGAVAPNYTFDYVDGSVTVNPALVTVTASSGSMTYGDTVPVITASYSGWVGGDGPAVLTTAPTCTSTATSASAAGTYPSSCSGAAADDYTFSYVDGTVSVNGGTTTGLTLSPQSGGPLPLGSSYTFTVTATDSNGEPVSGAAVALTVDGPNAATTTITTGADGKATYSYTGVNAGTDYAQATGTDATGPIASNTLSVVWFVPDVAVSSNTIHGRFYITSPDSYSFTAQPSWTPAFEQDFPTIDFNPAKGLIPGNVSGFDWEDTHTFTDITTDPSGHFTGSITAQGNGHVAGIGDMAAFNDVFTGNLAIAHAGNYTFDFGCDDGFMFFVGGGATHVSGWEAFAPSVSPFTGLPLMGGWNYVWPGQDMQEVVNFPAPGVYQFELDHEEAASGLVQMTMNVQVGSGTSQADFSPLASTASLILSPAVTTPAGTGERRTFTAFAQAPDGSPAAGVSVRFYLTNSGQIATVTTDSRGLASFSYSRDVTVTDAVFAEASIAGLPVESTVVLQQWNAVALTPPAIGAQTPLDGTEIAAPTQVTAAFTPPDGQTIRDWKVELAPTDDPSASKLLASGSGTPPATLATLDPTVLANGDYRITISAFASGGGGLSSAVDVIVSGNLKLGRYQVTYQDANVPVGGIPIQVQRTYDSFDKSQDAFGVGWTLGVANFRVYTNGALGESGWSQYDSGCFMAGLGGGLCQMAWATARPHFVSVVWPDGHTETFDFTPTGGSNLFWLGSAAFTARPGSTSKLEVTGDTSLSYSGDGDLYGGIGGPVFNPTRFTLTARDGTVYLLDCASGLVSETDRSGNTVTVDSSGIHSSLGPSITFTRDASGRISKLTKPDGTTFSYGHNGAGDLVSVTDERGNTATYDYDGNHNLTKTIDPNGQPLRTLVYDTNGRLQSIADGAGNTTTLALDPNARTETVTGPDPRLTTISSMDARGDIVQVDEVFDGKKITTKFTYDEFGHLLSETDPAGHVSQVTYDLAGSPVTVTGTDGGTWQFTYDDHEKLASVTDPSGRQVATLTYDSHGNLISRSTADGGTTTYSYNPSGLVGSMTDPLGHTTSYGYDSAGRATTVTGPDGRIWGYTYDADGRTLSVTDPASQQTTFGHDAAGNLTSVTDPAGNRQGYAYDRLGHLSSATDPLGHVTSYSYDAAGRMASLTDRNGATTGVEYDSAGRIIKVSLPGASSLTYTYDPLGELIEADDSDAALQFTYDDTGNVVSQTSAGTATSSQPSVAISFGRDAAGRLTSLGAPWGTTTYAYNTNGQLAGVTDPTGGLFSLGYDPLGRLASMSRPNGVTDSYVYDAAGELMSRTSTKGTSLIDALSYTYDSTGRRTSKTDSAGTTTYSYDAADRLISVLAPAGSSLPSESFTYDAVGSQTQAGQTYDAAKRLLSDSTYTYAYDAEGNLTRKTERATGKVSTYAWNALQELTSVTLPNGTTVTYRYDALSHRIEQSTATGTTRYINIGANVLAGYDGANVLRATYVTTPVTGVLPGVPLESVLGSTRSYPLMDGLGSVTAVTDSSGDVSSSFAYAAYGAPVGSSSGTYAYGTYGYDSSTGLYYARARYYDPSTGRFLSEDPLHGSETYGYAVSNPTNAVDPTGAEAAADYSSLLNDIWNGAVQGATLATIHVEMKTILHRGIDHPEEDLTGISIGGACGAFTPYVKFLAEDAFEGMAQPSAAALITAGVFTIALAADAGMWQALILAQMGLGERPDPIGIGLDSGISGTAGMLEDSGNPDAVAVGWAIDLTWNLDPFH